MVKYNLLCYQIGFQTPTGNVLTPHYLLQSFLSVILNVPNSFEQQIKQ